MNTAPTRESRRWMGRAHSVLGGAIVAGFLYYLWEHRTQLDGLGALSPLDFALIAGLILLSWLLNATQVYLLNRAAGANVGFWENLMLSTAATFGNYLPARLGTLIRAHYMKSAHGLRYARYGSILGVRTLLTIIAAGGMGLAASLWLAGSGGRLSPELLTLFGALVLAPMLAWLWRRKSAVSERPRNRIMRIWGDFAAGFHELKDRPGLGLAVIALLLAQYLTLGARFAVAAQGTAALEPLPMLLLLAPLAALMGFVSITPGGLGVRETVMGYATFAAGASFGDGLLVGVIDRAVLLVMVALFGGPCFVWIWLRVRSLGMNPQRVPGA